MARIKGAMMTRKRRKKTLKLAKGYYGSKSKHFKMAKQQVMKSGNYAFIGRKQKKRDFRRLWIAHQLCLPRAGRELFRLHERPEEERHRAEPQDAQRDGHPRRRQLQRAGGDREERPREITKNIRPCTRARAYVYIDAPCQEPRLLHKTGAASRLCARFSRRAQAFFPRACAPLQKPLFLRSAGA